MHTCGCVCVGPLISLVPFVTIWSVPPSSLLFAASDHMGWWIGSQPLVLRMHGAVWEARWQIRLWWSCFERFVSLIRQPGGERPPPHPAKSQRQLRAKLLFHLFDVVVSPVRSPRLCHAETPLFQASTQPHVCLKRLKCLREHSHIWMLHLLRNAKMHQWIMLFFHLLIENKIKLKQWK